MVQPSPRGSAATQAPLRGSATITAAAVTGWAFDPADESRRLEVRLLRSGTVLGETATGLPRPDVNRSLQIRGDHGFRFAPLALTEADIAALALEIRRGPEEGWQAVDIPKGPQRVRHYQSFGDVKGASDSEQKLRALRLGLLAGRAEKGEPLKGLSLLDLGCNEGFFCGEALRQGAARVLGIDHSRQFVARARERFPRAEFRQGSWWDLPDERFDVILFLSAIHYEPEPAALVKKLLDHLTPTGTLILECGIAPGAGKAWKPVRRADGIRTYPTEETFVDEVMAPYAVRLVGGSVAQRGDPVPRKVFHCVRRAGMALIVTGPTRSGKSTLADDLRRRDIPLVRTDTLLSEFRNAATPGTGTGTGTGTAAARLAAVVGRFPRGVPLLGRIGQAVAEDCPEAFVEVLLARAPLEAPLFCLEGEIFGHDAIVAALIRALDARGIRPWFAATPSPAAASATGWWRGRHGSPARRLPEPAA